VFDSLFYAFRHKSQIIEGWKSAVDYFYDFTFVWYPFSQEILRLHFIISNNDSLQKDPDLIGCKLGEILENIIIRRFELKFQYWMEKQLNDFALKYVDKFIDDKIVSPLSSFGTKWTMYLIEKYLFPAIAKRINYNIYKIIFKIACPIIVSASGSSILHGMKKVNDMVKNIFGFDTCSTTLSGVMMTIQADIFNTQKYLIKYASPIIQRKLTEYIIEPGVYSLISKVNFYSFYYIIWSPIYPSYILNNSYIHLPFCSLGTSAKLGNLYLYFYPPSENLKVDNFKITRYNLTMEVRTYVFFIIETNNYSVNTTVELNDGEWKKNKK